MQLAFYIIGGIILLFAMFQWRRVVHYSQISQHLEMLATARQHTPDDPDRRILIIGDSLWVGVGVLDPAKSLAGRLIADLPQALVVNQAKSGARITDGIKQLRSAVREHGNFDQVIIQLGANDIVQLTRPGKATTKLRQLLAAAHNVAPDVAYMVCGSVGFAPLFVGPVDWFYTAASRFYLPRLYAVAEDTGTLYIDFYRPRAEDPFYADPDKYYAADLFHPSGAGYGLWYEKCQENLQCFSYDKKRPTSVEEITEES
ncbi:MAG: SGNH/GDSL hydrolase family protein [Candidatus Paceibacterota bacterium]